jgi:hypothetical protein
MITQNTALFTIFGATGDLPHANGLYSRTAVMAYLER